MSTGIAAVLLASMIGATSHSGTTQFHLEDGKNSATSHVSSAVGHDSLSATSSNVAALAQTSPTPASFGVFHSVAISAAKLPAASRWQEARQVDFTGFFSADCAARGFSHCDSSFGKRGRDAAAKAEGLGERDMLDLVNRIINGAMTYRDDSKVWGLDDYWATPVEMAGKGAGDCEDYAIAKYWLLRSLGVPDDRLQLVVLQDTRRQLFHAVLVAHMDGGSYVLDNVSNRLAMDSDYSQYQPIVSFAGAKNFIHGFESGVASVAAMPSDLSLIAPGSGL